MKSLRAHTLLLACLGLLAVPVAPAPADEAGPSVDAKLFQHWERWEVARRLLLDRLDEKALPVERLEWEATLATDPEFVLTDDDRAVLAARHRDRIERARQAARAASVIDLDRVRAAGQVRDFCRALPKGGMLHVHPNGTLERLTVRVLLERVDPVLRHAALAEGATPEQTAVRSERLAFLTPYGKKVQPSALSPVDRERLEDLFFAPAGGPQPPLMDFIFTMLRTLRSRSYAGYGTTVYRDFFRRAQAQGVSYVEFTKGLDASQSTRNELARLARMAERDFGVVARWNLGLGRAANGDSNRRRVSGWIAKPQPDLVTGIDLYGNEAPHPAFEAAQEPYAVWLKALREGETSMRATFHAQGVGDDRNTRDALILGADRLSHALGLMRDPVALEYAIERRLPVESNLLWNQRFHYLERIEDDPFLDLLRLGLRVSLSTDGEGILESTISDECALAVTATDVTWAELRQMVLNSIETAFASASTRARVDSALRRDLARFEARWVKQAGAAPVP